MTRPGQPVTRAELLDARRLVEHRIDELQYRYQSIIEDGAPITCIRVQAVAPRDIRERTAPVPTTPNEQQKQLYRSDDPLERFGYPKVEFAIFKLLLEHWNETIKLIDDAISNLTEEREPQ